MPAIFILIHYDGQILLFFKANSYANKRVDLVEKPQFIFDPSNK